jgi:hypothetical protein
VPGVKRHRESSGNGGREGVDAGKSDKHLKVMDDGLVAGLCLNR